jgi:dihydropteroate synthase
LRADEGMAALCAERGVDVVLMHMRGEPRTMQDNPVYDDVVDEVKAFLAQRIEYAIGEGVAEERIWIDPGIGFGKTVEHNLQLLRRLGELTRLGPPIVVGASRKAFIGKITGAPVEDRLGGTIAACAIAYANGARMVRVHDVGEVAQAMRAAEAILGRRDWRAPM